MKVEVTATSDAVFTKIVSLSTNTLRAMLLAVPSFDVRYYLLGVLFDTTKQRLVATDGHCMLVKKVEMESKQVESSATYRPRPFIVPVELLQAAVKQIGRLKADVDQGIRVSISNDVGVRTVAIETNKGHLYALEIDGRYPDYERCIPRHCNGVMGSYNPEFLERMQRAIAIDAGKERKDGPFHSSLAHNHGGSASGGAIMTGGNTDILAMIMPKREGVVNTYATLANMGLEAEPQGAKKHKAA